MSDLRTELERAGRLAPPLEHDAFEGLRTRRERKARRGRVAAATFSLTLAAVAIGGAAGAFQPHNAPATPRPHGGGSVRRSHGPAGPVLLPRTRTWYGPPSQGDGRHWPRALRDADLVPGGRLGPHHRDPATVTGTDRPYDPGNFQPGHRRPTYLSTDPSAAPRADDRPDAAERALARAFDQFTPGPGQDGHDDRRPGALDRRAARTIRTPSPRSRPRCSRSRADSRGWTVTGGRRPTPTGRPATLLTHRDRGASSTNGGSTLRASSSWPRDIDGPWHRATCSSADDRGGLGRADATDDGGRRWTRPSSRRRSHDPAKPWYAAPQPGRRRVGAARARRNTLEPRPVRASVSREGARVIAVRVVVGLLGAAVVIATFLSAVRTVVLPRGGPRPPRAGRLPRACAWSSFCGPAPRIPTSAGTAILAMYAPIGLLSLLAVWMALTLVGYACIYWALGDIFVRRRPPGIGLLAPHPWLPGAVLRGGGRPGPH